MADVATLGIAIDSRQAVSAKKALDDLTASAKPAARAAQDLQKATTGAAAGAASLSKGSSQAAKDTAQFAKSGNLARHELINLSRQIQDVGVSLASGQAFWTVAIQQGSQLADIYGSSRTGTVGGSLKQIGGIVSSVLTPMRVLGVGVAASGMAAYAAYGSWKTYTLQLDDTARSINTTTQSLSALQALASSKGISGDEFSKGISQFGRGVYDAKNNMGGLADVFRANNIHAVSFDDALEKAADLIRRARDDQQRLVLLQQMGLPATMQWVRLLSGGAEGLNKAKAEFNSFAADQRLVQQAREFDEAWNKAWTNFGLNARSAFQSGLSAGSGFFDELDRRAKQFGNSSFWNRFITPEGMKAAGIDAVSPFDQRFAGDGPNAAANNLALQSDVAKRAASMLNPTKDPNALRNEIALAQTRIGLLGQTPSVQQLAQRNDDTADKKESQRDSDHYRSAA